MEVHANPREALSDADNAVALRDLVSIWRVLREIHGVVLQNENK
jgi:3-deoxy-D-manno-octulosonic acid (KDO) 8-phosphate synthase